MGRIVTTKELFEEEKPGWKNRMQGVSLPSEEEEEKTKPVGELTLEKTEDIKIPEKPKNELDVLNESIEKNYKECLKLEKNLTEFDTTLEGIPPNIQPSIIANYNKEVTHFNSLVKTLQDDITKRDVIYSVQKREAFIEKKRFEDQKVEIPKTKQRPPMLDLDKANKFIAAPLKGIIHGIYSSPQAVGGLMRLVGENMQEVEGTPNIFKGDEDKYTDLMKAIAEKPKEDSIWGKSVSKLLVDKSQEIIKANREFLSKKELHPDIDSKTAAWLFQLGSGATSLAGAVGISLLTGSPHAAAVAFGMYQTGSMYQEAREADVEVKKAAPLAVTAGVVEGALEYVGLQWLFTKFGGNFWVDRVLHAGLEGFQEFSQQVGENIVAKVGWEKTRSLWEGTAESASIGAVLGGGASAITTNAEQSVDLTELTAEQKKGLIGAIVEKQLKTIPKILSNLNPKTIMEKVKTDPDIQRAILGIFEMEAESEAFAYKVEQKKPIVPEELEAKRELLREHGVNEKLLADDEFVKKAKITELPKADVTQETVSEKTIKKLEELVGKETTPKEVLKKVEKAVKPKEELKAGVKEPKIPKLATGTIETIIKEDGSIGYSPTDPEGYHIGEYNTKEKAEQALEEVREGQRVLTLEDFIIDSANWKFGGRELTFQEKVRETIAWENHMKEEVKRGWITQEEVDKAIVEGMKYAESLGITRTVMENEMTGKKEELKAEPKAPIIPKELEGLTEKAKKYESVEQFAEALTEEESKIFYSKNEGYIPPEDLTTRENYGKKSVQDILVNKETGEDISPIPTQAAKEDYLKNGYSRPYIWDYKKLTDFYTQATAITEKTAVVEEVAKEVSPAKQVEEPPKPPVPPKETAEIEEEPEFDKEVKVGDVYTEGEELTPKQVKAKVREVTGQTKGEKIELYESDMLKYVLKGEERTAREVFKAGKKEGIFATKEKFEEKIEKIKEHQKEVKAKAKEKEAQKKYIKKLIDDINKLPTQNIAVDYRDKIEAIKDTFDLKKRQKKTLHAREETAKFIEREIAEGNTNLKIPQEVIDIIKKIPLNDMTIAQLEDVHDTILQLAHIGKTKGKLLKIQKGRRLEELVQDLINTLSQGKEVPTGKRNIRQELKEAESLKKQVKDIWSHFWINTTLDEALFERMDGAKRGLWCETFYDAVNKCTNDELSSTFKKIEDSQNFIADKKIDIVKFLQERTGDLMLTPSQRTGVYLCSLDEDAKRHIQNAGVYLMKGMKEPYKFTDKDISDVVDSLTEEEKAMVKNYQEYQLSQGNELDEFDVRVRGVHLKKVENRYAIQVINEDLDNSMAIDMERNPMTRRAYLEQGFRKERTHRAENVINIDCVSNMLRDMAKVEHYKAYEETVIDINNLLTNEELKNAIIQNPKYGRIVYDNIVQWFKDSVKAKQSKILSTSDKTLMFLRTSAFFSMLGVNVISGSKQLVSLCNAVAETNLTTILSGIEQVALHYNETKQFVFQRDPQMRARKGQIDKIMREWMETTDAKQILTGKTKDVRMKTLFLIRALDEFAVLSVWKGTYDQAINQGKSDKEAIKRAGEVMRKTQPAALTKDLPQWFRDGTVANLFSLFQNQINKNQNYIRHDMFGKLKAGQISPGTFAHRVLWGWMLPAVLIGTITRGRPPEDWKELVKDMGVYYIGGWFFVGSIVVNMMEGYGGWTPAPLSFGEEFVKAATYKTWESKFKHGISGICKVIGLAYNQPYRTIDGADDLIQGETEDIRRLIWAKSVLGEEEKKTLVKGKPSKPTKPSKPSKPIKPKKP